MGGVVVGFDGSPGAKQALEWALAEARARRVPLRVVSAWTYPILTVLPVAPVPPIPENIVNAARNAIDRALQDLAWDGESPSVERLVVHGGAAATLLEVAKDADLLVVGARGIGGFGGLLLGSVSDQCVRHSPCPVVVVPPKGEVAA